MVSLWSKDFMARIALDDPKFYFNRHVQWLAFNQRILEEARDGGLGGAPKSKEPKPDGACAKVMHGDAPTVPAEPPELEGQDSTNAIV